MTYQNFPVLPSPSIRTREEFGWLLNLRGLTGTAVEIGTHQGEFAAELLRRWQGRRLCCVDPWKTDLEGYVDDVLSERDREEDYREAMRALAPFGIIKKGSPFPGPDDRRRVFILRKTSEEAAKSFPVNTLDFVYIDGNHDTKYVAQDLQLWYPRLRPGGILAGHDLDGNWAAAVRPPVLVFAMIRVLPIFFVPGDAASWYILKP